MDTVVDKSSIQKKVLAPQMDDRKQIRTASAADFDAATNRWYAKLTGKNVSSSMPIAKDSVSPAETKFHSKDPNGSLGDEIASTSTSAINRSCSIVPKLQHSFPGGATLTAVSSPLCSTKRVDSTQANITPSVTITPTTAPPMGNNPCIKLPTAEFPKVNFTSNNALTITPVPSLSSQYQSNIFKDDASMPLMEGELLVQQKAMAKTVLRNDLTKTIMELPLPQGSNTLEFLPDHSNLEFFYLLGLEIVVDRMVDNGKKRRSEIQILPKQCAKCHTDFTTEWKWENRGKNLPRIICKNCFTSDTKEALRGEHTEKVKKLMVKAFQEEKEIDKIYETMQNSTTTADSLQSTRSSTSNMQQKLAQLQLQQQTTATATRFPNLPRGLTVTPSKGPSQNTTAQPSYNTPQQNSSNAAPRQYEPERDKQREQIQQPPQQYNKSPNSAHVSAAPNLSNSKYPANSSSIGDKGPHNNLAAVNSSANLGAASNKSDNAGLADSTGASSALQANAAVQAFQQQLFRELQSLAENPLQMMQYFAQIAAFSNYSMSSDSTKQTPNQTPDQAPDQTPDQSPSLAAIQLEVERQRQHLMNLITQTEFNNNSPTKKRKK